MDILDKREADGYGFSLTPDGEIRMWVGDVQSPPLQEEHLNDIVETVAEFRKYAVQG